MAQVDSVQDLGQVFLPMQINGGTGLPYYFILDTGAGMSAVDQKIASALALPTIGSTELAGTAGVQNVQIKQFDSLTPLRRLNPVQELTHYGLVATTQDLSQFKVPMPNTPEAGLLGNDYLRHFVVEIEFLPPALFVSRPYGFLPNGVDPSRSIPMWLDENKIMRVRGRLDDWLEVELRVDSGAATLNLNNPYLNVPIPVWNQLCERHPDYQFYTELQAGGIGGSVNLKVGKIGSFEIGPLRFEKPDVVVQPEIGIFANTNSVGFISLNLFEPGKWITFDYPNGKIFLPPPVS